MVECLATTIITTIIIITITIIITTITIIITRSSGVRLWGSGEGGKVLCLHGFLGAQSGRLKLDLISGPARNKISIRSHTLHQQRNQTRNRRPAAESMEGGTKDYRLGCRV